LSAEARAYLKLGDACLEGVMRDDKNLVKCVEELGESADGACADLEVVDIPDGVKWSIQQHDGKEWIVEKHRTW